MHVRRVATTMLAMTATVTLGVSGCGAAATKRGGSGSVSGCSRGEAQAAAERQAEGEAELAAAARWVTEQAVRVAFEDADATGGAVMHAQEREGTMNFQFRGTNRTLLVTVLQDDVYFSMFNVPGASFGTSYRLPRSEVPVGSRLDIAPEDPGNVGRLIKAVVSARPDSGGKASAKSGFTGEVDVMATPYADEELCRKFGDKVHAVPFTAAVDDQGRLVEFVVKLNALAPELGSARTAWYKVDVETNTVKPRSSEPARDVLGLLNALER